MSAVAKHSKDYNFSDYQIIFMEQLMTLFTTYKANVYNLKIAVNPLLIARLIVLPPSNMEIFIDLAFPIIYLLLCNFCLYIFLQGFDIKNAKWFVLLFNTSCIFVLTNSLANEFAVTCILKYRYE